MGAGFCAQSVLRQIREPDDVQLSWRSRKSQALMLGLVLIWTAFVVGNLRGDEVFGSFARPEFWPTVYMAVFLRLPDVCPGRRHDRLLALRGIRWGNPRGRAPTHGRRLRVGNRVRRVQGGSPRLG